MLLVSIDTLRADHLGFYGYERFTSPVLDTLAIEGVVFEDVSSTASWTLPSHVSMLTGLFPREHGASSYSSGLPEGVPTLAGMLSGAGWDTAAVVNVEWLKRESFFATRDFGQYLWAPASLSRRTANSWVTDQALEWIEAMGDAPLFVFAHYYDLHSDYAAEDAYERLFVSPYEGPFTGSGSQLKLQAIPDGYLDACRKDFDPDRCKFGDVLVLDDSAQKLEMGPADVKRLEELYDSQIRQLDSELARLFTALRRSGLLEQTLLIITSDHGEEFMERGGVEHSYTAYQEVVRVPLLIRGPDMPAGLRVAAPVSLVDLAPTILAQTGIDSDAPMQGLDLSPLWKDGDDSAFRERHLFIEAPGGASQNVLAGEWFPVWYGVRQGRYKLVYEQLSESHALYDLLEDPGEERDVSQGEPEMAGALLDVLLARISGSEDGQVDGVEVQLDDEAIERLRALGYVP